MHKSVKHRLLLILAVEKSQVLDFIHLVQSSTILHKGYYAKFDL